MHGICSLHGSHHIAPQYVLAQPRLHRVAQNKTSRAKQQDKAYRVLRLVLCTSEPRLHSATTLPHRSDRPLHSGLTGGAVDRPNEQHRRLALLIAIRSGKCIVQNCCAATSANLLSTNLGALTPGREGRSARERESAMARTRPPSSCSIRCTSATFPSCTV